jgi:hypothetical protein
MQLKKVSPGYCLPALRHAGKVVTYSIVCLLGTCQLWHAGEVGTYSFVCLLSTCELWHAGEIGIYSFILLA